MELKKVRVVYLPVSNLEAWEHQPKGRADANRSLKELAKAIISTRYVSPLVVVPKLNNGHYLVYDGNRRLQVMKDLNQKTVPCEVIEPADLNLEPDMFFGAINTSKAITGNERQLIWRKTRNLEVLTRSQRVRFAPLLRMLGTEYIDGIIDNGFNVSTLYLTAEKLCKAINKPKIATNYALIIDWIMEHKERTMKLDVGLNEGIFKPSWLWKQIQNNEPVTGVLYRRK